MNSVLILILSIPLIEIYIFIKIGSSIGAFNTISLILLTAIIGVAYARYEGFNTLKSGMAQLVKNEVPIYEIVSGAALTFAAILLIIPGFATDLLGLLLIFPFLFFQHLYLQFQQLLNGEIQRVLFFYFLLHLCI